MAYPTDIPRRTALLPCALLAALACTGCMLQGCVGTEEGAGAQGLGKSKGLRPVGPPMGGWPFGGVRAQSQGGSAGPNDAPSAQAEGIKKDKGTPPNERKKKQQECCEPPDEKRGLDCNLQSIPYCERNAVQVCDPDRSGGVLNSSKRSKKEDPAETSGTWRQLYKYGCRNPTEQKAGHKNTPWCGPELHEGAKNEQDKEHDNMHSTPQKLNAEDNDFPRCGLGLHEVLLGVNKKQGHRRGVILHEEAFPRCGHDLHEDLLETNKKTSHQCGGTLHGGTPPRCGHDLHGKPIEANKEQCRWCGVNLHGDTSPRCGYGLHEDLLETKRKKNLNGYGRGKPHPTKENLRCDAGRQGGEYMNKSNSTCREALAAPRSKSLWCREELHRDTGKN